MDVFERVREVDAEVRLTMEQISAARSRLLEGIDAGTAAARKRVSRRPMLLIAGAVAGVAAATATVVVVSQPTDPEPRVEAVPAPSLDPRKPGEAIPHPRPTSGTGVTEPFPGTTPQAGQYLSVQTTEDLLWYRGPEATVYQWSYRPDTSPPLSAAVMRSASRLFVPADRSGEWVGSDGPRNHLVDLYTDVEGDTAEWESTLPPVPEARTWRSAGGIPSDAGLVSGTLESYEQFPDDPEALIAYVREMSVQWEVPADASEEWAMASIMTTLVDNYAPAAARVTFLQALASRAETVGVDGSITTYRMRFTRFPASGPYTVTVSIDTATGWVSEYTARWDRADGAEADMVPDGVPDIRRTFTVSIVDAIP